MQMDALKHDNFILSFDGSYLKKKKKKLWFLESILCWMDGLLTVNWCSLDSQQKNDDGSSGGSSWLSG